MVSGKTSGFTINHINVKILIIIDKYVPLAVTSNNQFIAPPYLRMQAAKHELFMWYFCTNDII